MNTDIFGCQRLLEYEELLKFWTQVNYHLPELSQLFHATFQHFWIDEAKYFKDFPSFILAQKNRISKFENHFEFSRQNQWFANWIFGSNWFFGSKWIFGSTFLNLTYFDTLSHCLKITLNVAFEFFNFGIFHQFLTY